MKHIVECEQIKLNFYLWWVFLILCAIFVVFRMILLCLTLGKFCQLSKHGHLRIIKLLCQEIKKYRVKTNTWIFYYLPPTYLPNYHEIFSKMNMHIKRVNASESWIVNTGFDLLLYYYKRKNKRIKSCMDSMLDS